MTADEYLNRLDELNWFADMPDDRAAEIRQSVREQVEGGAKRIYPALAEHYYDSEMIYDFGPDEDLSYHGLITALAGASSGSFEPTNIEDRPDVDNDIISVAFDHGGKRYEFDADLTDWVDTELYKQINQALADSGSPVRMYELDIADQCVFCVFKPVPTMNAAIEAGLVRARLAGR